MNILIAITNGPEFCSEYLLMQPQVNCLNFPLIGHNHGYAELMKVHTADVHGSQRLKIEANTNKQILDNITNLAQIPHQLKYLFHRNR